MVDIVFEDSWMLEFLVKFYIKSLRYVKLIIYELLGDIQHALIMLSTDTQWYWLFHRIHV